MIWMFRFEVLFSVVNNIVDVPSFQEKNAKRKKRKTAGEMI